MQSASPVQLSLLQIVVLATRIIMVTASLLLAFVALIALPFAAVVGMCALCAVALQRNSGRRSRAVAHGYSDDSYE